MIQGIQLGNASSDLKKAKFNHSYYLCAFTGFAGDQGFTGSSGNPGRPGNPGVPGQQGFEGPQGQQGMLIDANLCAMLIQFKILYI